MKFRYIRLYPIIALLIICNISSSCKKNEVEPSKPVSDINDLIRSVPELPALPLNGMTLQSQNKQSYSLPSGELSCEETKYLINRVGEEFVNVNFDGNASISELYPGSIIRLKELRNKGTLNSIGNIAREDLNLSTTLSSATSKKVVSPTASSIKDALEELITKYKNNVKAQYTYNINEAYNSEQGLLELGLNINYGLLNTNNKLKISEKIEDKSVFISFIQKYHTVSTDYPTNPAGFFSSKASINDIKSYITDDNPLGFVSQVTYGRIVIAKITYSGKEQISQVNLAAKLRAGISTVGLSLNQEAKKILTNSTIEVSILGGKAEEAIKAINSSEVEKTLQNIHTFIQSNANDASYGFPISYTVRYLSNNNLFYSGGSAIFTQKNCQDITPKAMIKSITFLTLPQKDKSGSAWDVFDYPDVYYRFSTPKGEQLATGLSRRVNNVTPQMLSSGQIIWKNVNYQVDDIYTEFDIDAFDYDDLANDEFMGFVRFKMSDYTKATTQNSVAFPSKIRKIYTDTNTGYMAEVEIEVEWR